MKIAVIGSSGRMGKEVMSVLLARGIQAYGVDISGAEFELPNKMPIDADAVIEFASAGVTEMTLAYAEEHNIPAIIGTTGHTSAQIERMKSASRTIPVYYSANYSEGMNAVLAAMRILRKSLPSAKAEIIEIHHEGKKDAPSGSAKLLDEALGGNTGIHSLRMGKVFGVHEVIIDLGDERITVRHEACSRRIFAEGAVNVACRAIKSGAGFRCAGEIFEWN